MNAVVEHTIKNPKVNTGSEPLRVLIMAGGTGGHVFPALAVAKELIAQGAFVSWLGTRRGIESRLVPEAGIDIDYITIEGVRGKGMSSLLKAPFLIAKAVRQSMSVLRQRRAQVVLGLGGFASGPGGVAARLMNIPVVIHEQNAAAGTTNKLLARIAQRVLVAFPKAFSQGKWVGNPVRPEISALPSPKVRLAQLTTEENAPLKILVLGGSLGATAINQLLPEALALLKTRVQASMPVLVRHQVGEKHVSATCEYYQQQDIDVDGKTIDVMPFIADMAEAYGWADFIICRAGALTVAEITAAGCAALMVPFPHAIDDHQTKNAQWLVDNKAGMLIPQSQLNAERLCEEIEHKWCHRSELLAMAVNAKALAMPGAATEVVNVCREVCRRG
ncbi:undecaprenyldiphospho-muramoylpentapeptide beta-N-acetylglucosaminyltransferase [Marinibactrum halimedae]|uniref:UDP-N-acetylglucosamine--N-acetylmuramyl-(pentapeptide) pyrophosphoryl-undecaprenol N-acetylglucosamine transferase n=1 Tax=Marinibactrum halimedae TaxID=1444977 RepID=A0AA37T644_9GAMM|nr:undecaprenyldiphospho-muramoylpentapeptide beta-N-acetylglucosaminyltransferase [Marinibactrum halimedae]MCD9459605.1 undecaprenyldiphospho-muramoylpentapeptide beta-N-acetylglucosaminyltransferase [Marinibactrum halimedae]GLS25577.1 UDP-N-acetylglucosamine--N-acetylmuramyl-(pentapeptide) pyrophosphoryl-undecaprenol N-acetylglucosamine transferase [Marinibactrum halimedae]